MIRYVRLLEVGPDATDTFCHVLVTRPRKVTSLVSAFIVTIIAYIFHEVPDVLIRFRTDDESGNAKAPSVGKDSGVSGSETVVDHDDDTVEDEEPLIIEVFPIGDFQGTRSGNIVPDEAAGWVWVWVSGHHESGLVHANRGSIKIHIMLAPERVYQ